MSQPIQDYFDALNRLKTGTAIRISKGTSITNDAVALEAGRGKGSIKKSRSIFADLIAAIDLAASEQFNGKKQHKEKLNEAKLAADRYRLDLEAALAREVSLLYELYDVKKQLAALTGGNVLPIRGS
ncbi:hypothetical protein DF053_03340 [Burkholderia cepacia]|uniref:hypothetical protein n=1 Tax=Burkholderia cepacia TaxID=292 RepID=UPI000F59DB39|nr:hypothetical protein [Burkholderia cepacia]RQU90645.1 hypothetical protein DF133_13515 [Burkholderia cenocepacia]RQV30291.1 hypothetical protein DF132_04155 [Burkholderia cenocepacia]RQV88915.1 hypothetical protein DF019_16445 [Burkholderia cenocepacia]RQZ91010.1 hypothetical protein DF053_03340 [Burkholderia cepacia]RQZ98381.1 hypothetical protein DF058_05780 [Burkholderia cenocepacia]